MMRLIFVLLMVLSHSCSTIDHDELNKLTQMWRKKLKKSQILDLYGREYKPVEKGITYLRSKSTWPKYAFFFNEEDTLIDQFALLDKGELENLKKNLDCNWKETKKKIKTPHSVQIVPTGKCEKSSLQYEFKKDWGLYEVRWIK